MTVKHQLRITTPEEDALWRDVQTYKIHHRFKNLNQAILALLRQSLQSTKKK